MDKYMHFKEATYSHTFVTYCAALSRDGRRLEMNELEHFWSMTDFFNKDADRATHLLHMLRLDGVQFNMNFCVWGDGSDAQLKEGLLVLLHCTIRKDKQKIILQPSKGIIFLW